MARITFVGQCISGLEIIEESSFINIKHVFCLVSIYYFGKFFVFQSIIVLEFTMALSPDNLVYQVVCFLKMVNPAI